MTMIIRRNYETGDTCHLCGKDLAPVIPALSGMKTYAFDDGKALCQECARALASRTGQSVDWSGWIGDMLLDLYGEDALKDADKPSKTFRPARRGRKAPTMYQARLRRMRRCVENAPSADYAVLHMRYAGCWPDKFPEREPYRNFMDSTLLHRIQDMNGGDVAKTLEDAIGRMKDPSRKKYILEGASDLSGRFSQKALNLLWAFGVSVMADLDMFSLDEALARLSWSTGRNNAEDGWMSVSIDPRKGMAGAIVEIYDAMEDRYGNGNTCGPVIMGPDRQCLDCINRNACPYRAEAVYEEEMPDDDDDDKK